MTAKKCPGQAVWGSAWAIGGAVMEHLGPLEENKMDEETTQATFTAFW